MFLFGLMMFGPDSGQPVPATELDATFIGNAAFHLTDGTVAVLTDFPYESGAFGYMEWSKHGVPAGPAPLCVISHSHADHFSPKLAREFCGQIVGPVSAAQANEVEVVTLKPEMRFGGLSVTFFATPHGDVEHYSFLLEWGDKRLYFTGDTDDTDALLAVRDLDVAFVSPWLLEEVRERGDRIDARQVVVYHHRTGEVVTDFQNRVVPAQGQVLSIGARRVGLSSRTRA